MEIQLLRDNPYNTVLILDAAPLYQIKSLGFFHNKTEVRRAHKDMAIEETTPVAIIEWKRMFERTTVELGGQTRPWDDILSKTGPWYSHARTFLLSGDVCTWKFAFGGKLSLVNSASETIVDYSRSCVGVFKPSVQAILNVSQECIPMLDLVIVTWIIMERKHREREHKQRSGGA